MPQPLRVQCNCGQFQAQLEPARLPLLARCYCVDCQRYAQFFPHPEQLLDGQNSAGETGSAVMVIHPPQLRIVQGAAQLRCIQQRPKGAWRWYAACCQTPILNMAAQTQTHHLALLLSALEPNARAHYRAQPMLCVRQHAAIKTTLQQCLLFTSFALRYALGMLYAKITQAHRHNALIDAESGQPISVVQSMDAATYAQLDAKRLARANAES